LPPEYSAMKAPPTPRSRGAIQTEGRKRGTLRDRTSAKSGERSASRAFKHKCRLWKQWWLRVWLTSAGLSVFATQGFAQGQLAPPAPSAAATSSSSSSASIGQVVAQLAQAMNLITAFGFLAGCVMVMSGFLNARRDEYWKMTVIYGLGVAGSVALMKALFGLFVASSASFINQF
jgi:hypothetical protein